MRSAILLLHGPNLNLLGRREPQYYGNVSLAALDERLLEVAAEQGCDLKIVQSQAEHVLIERIHASLSDGTQFIIFNPAGFTHTSIALRDSLAAVNLPFIEVHLSNIYSREPFRHHSYFSDLALGTISGLGPRGYEWALRHAIDYLEIKSQQKE